MKIFRTWTFSWWQVGVLKVCLISFGILLGLYFHEYLVTLVWLWWTLFMVTTTYFVARFVRES